MSSIATNTEAFTVMETPELIQRTRDLWRDQLVDRIPESERELVQNFDVALTAALSRLHGLYEATGIRR